TAIAPAALATICHRRRRGLLLKRLSMLPGVDRHTVVNDELVHNIEERSFPTRKPCACRRRTGRTAVAGILIRRDLEGDEPHELHQCRTGKLPADLNLFRGPRGRFASRVDPW